MEVKKTEILWPFADQISLNNPACCKLLSMLQKSKILYDGNCVVCDIEISHYKRIAPQDFEMVDISNPAFKAGEFGLTTDAVNRHMHVMSPDGKIHIGVDAFTHIWSRIPRYRFAKKVVELPGLRSLAGVGYEVFVRVRPYLPKKNA